MQKNKKVKSSNSLKITACRIHPNGKNEIRKLACKKQWKKINYFYRISSRRLYLKDF